MRHLRLSTWALAALLSLFFLIFVGAIVRVTGAGLGCPDWPTCWGELIPPTHVDDVDFEKLDLEKFRRRAARLGRAQEDITVKTLRAEFNPRHTWTEFLNRLSSLPISLTTLALFLIGLFRPRLALPTRLACFAAFALVLANALIGALVVSSRLHSGVISLHLALAFLLTFVLVYLLWTGELPLRQRPRLPGPGRLAISITLLLVIAEGFLGVQIREMTDELMRSHLGESRESWLPELEHTAVYLTHRSFSWLIFFAVLHLAWKARWRGFVPRLSLALVLSLMVMGLILAHIGILAVVQVLHVGFAALLSATLFYWLLAAHPPQSETLRIRPQPLPPGNAPRFS